MERCRHPGRSRDPRGATHPLFRGPEDQIHTTIIYKPWFLESPLHWALHLGGRIFVSLWSFGPLLLACSPRLACAARQPHEASACLSTVAQVVESQGQGTVTQSEYDRLERVGPQPDGSARTWLWSLR